MSYSVSDLKPACFKVMSKVFLSFHIHCTSIFDNDYLLEFKSKIKNINCVRDICRTYLYKNRKTYLIGFSLNGKYI